MCLVAIGGWVAAILVGAQVWPGGDDGGRYAAVIYGAVFFGAIFGFSLWTMRRTQRRARSELYDRLALRTVSDDELRASTKGMYRIGYVYLALGAVVTGLGLAAVAVSGTDWERRLIWIAVAVVVGWLGYMFYALWTVTTASDTVFAPLGLQLASIPTVRTSLFHDIASLEGSTSFTGNRRGRDVVVVLGVGAATTVVGGPPTTRSAPSSAAQMAALTGERAQAWRNVRVDVADDGVAVHRTGRDAGRWFLHDLLLAECVAGSLPPPG